MNAERGKDSAGDVARKGFRAERAGDVARKGFRAKRAGDVARKGFRAERAGDAARKGFRAERFIWRRMPTQSRGHGTRRTAIQKHARKTHTSCDGRD